MLRCNLAIRRTLRRGSVAAICPILLSHMCLCDPLSTFTSAALTLPVRCASTSLPSENKMHIYTSKLPTVMDTVNGETTLYEYLMKRMAAVNPDKPAAIQAENGKALTYPQLIEASEHAAAAMYEAGVRRGDIVCICMLNSTFYGPLVYGTLRLGAVTSMVNAVSPPATLAYYLKSSKAKVILGMNFSQRKLEEAVDLVLRETGQKVTILYPERFFRKTDIPRIPSDYNGLKGATLDDTVAIPFSSGTTGLPKGVQLTNRSLIACTEQSSAAFGIDEDAVTITILPLFHIFGFTTCLNCVTSSGATQVVMSKFSVDEYTRMIEKYRATMNLVAPPILISLLKNKELVKQRDLSSLTRFCSASAPLGKDVIQLVEAMLPGTSVAQGYGMTEMSPTLTVPFRNESCTPGSCGRLIADTELRVVKVDDSQQSGADKSAGVDVKPGEEGEIWVRGPQMMKGYLKDEDTAVTMQDGWYRTGDIGKMLESGELMITDRLKELIKYKGFQVSPAGLEAVLLGHPWVKDCVVIGVPDPRDVSFENPRALVVLQPDVPTKDAVRASDELYRYVMSRMPPHKRLHGGVRIVEDIPHNDTGKVMRRVARQQEVAMLKASAAEAKAEREKMDAAEKLAKAAVA